MCFLTVLSFTKNNMNKIQLLQKDEIQPGISAAEFAQRRHLLASQLPDGGIAVLQAAPQFFMTGVIPYPYRQDADFQYMTGCIQPGPVASIHSDGRFILFFPDRDQWRETWDGARISLEASLQFFGADEAYPLSEMPQRLSRMLTGASSVAVDVNGGVPPPPLAGTPIPVAHLPVVKAMQGQGKTQSLRHLVHQLRWIKSPAEVHLMRRAAEAATSAMVECMQRSTPGVSEHSLASIFEHRCRMEGAQRMSYPPVVAGGVNATTIHYSRNDRTLPANEMLLLDGGCELYGYCSDVTRTWPINGKFSGAQSAVYTTVLEAHRRLLSATRPGVTLRALHQASIQLLAEALADLGVVKGVSAEAIVREHTIREFYPHSVGHFLGMDVHDTASMSHDRPLEAGVVLTIEPGLYIPDREEFGALAGIGVRLEDDVAVTVDGAEVLSAGAPLDPGEVEALVGSIGRVS